jgi:glycosyltransferase involved in cell wall biosynthesis
MASSRLKIAQLTPYYWPAIGGVEVVCQYISEELVKRGHEVHVFSSHKTHKGTPGLSMPRTEIINRVTVRRFRSYMDVGHYKVCPGMIYPLAREGFDIIHTHGYRQPQSEFGSRIGRINGVPTLLHVHGGFYTDNIGKQMFYQLYDWLSRKHKVNNFDHFIALSELDRRSLINLNIDQANISIIANAAEDQAFEEINAVEFKRRHGLGGKKIILYLGILHRYKRPDLLIRVLPSLLKKVPEVFVLFVGPDAGELKSIHQAGEELGVTTNYRWIGPLRGKEKHEALECSEFLALPSDEDPYPLVLLEAMAHGKPVLTTDVVGQASIIKANEAGIVVSPGDTRGIEEGAFKLLTDDIFRETIGSNARRLAAKAFSVRSVVDEVEALYKYLIGSKRKSELA